MENLKDLMSCLVEEGADRIVANPKDIDKVIEKILASTIISL